MFRPHAHFYWVLQGKFPMINRRQRDGLLANLGSGRVDPKLVFHDQNLRRLSSSVAKFFEQTDWSGSRNQSVSSSV